MTINYVWFWYNILANEKKFGFGAIFVANEKPRLTGDEMLTLRFIQV